MSRAFLIAVCFFLLTASAAAQTERTLKLAVLDFANSSFGHTTADKVAANFKASNLVILDRDLVRAAAKGAGYDGSLNLTRKQARDLGATLDCHFYLLGDTQTLRRSPSSKPDYFEAYASLFLVSSRTGNLVAWDRPTFEAAESKDAELMLLAALAGTKLREQLLKAMRLADDAELRETVYASESVTPVIEEAPGDEKEADALGLRLPRPFRRLRPPYPETAARAEAEATVDVLTDIDAKGEVTRIEVERWAGFGLDTVTIETVRQLHFFPALRNGNPVPVRVMLRYNFRKPPRAN